MMDAETIAEVARKAIELITNDSMLLKSDFLAANGYLASRSLDGGKTHTLVLAPFAFTTAILVGVDATGYQRRYCYESREEAFKAFLEYDGIGDPSGPWIKMKANSGDRLGPGAIG